MRVAVRILDLFCGAGGAAYGYHKAGFSEIVGVDIRVQRHYPYEFIRASALDVLRYPGYHGIHLGDFDAIHASPPCQAFTVYGNNKAHVRNDHPNHIPETRMLLRASGRPYVIENVYGARSQLEDPVMLCGTSFGIPVRRHRMFETSFELPNIPCDHGRFTERIFPGSSNRPNGRTVCNVGEYRVPLPSQQAAMGISWMSLSEIAQAIPPVYTQYIGSQLALRLKGLWSTFDEEEEETA